MILVMDYTYHYWVLAVYSCTVWQLPCTLDLHMYTTTHITVTMKGCTFMLATPMHALLHVQLFRAYRKIPICLKFGQKNACVEDLDTANHKNTSTVVRAVEGCAHARTIDDCNPKTWQCQGMLF